MRTETLYYSASWETYRSATREAEQSSVWDVDPSLASAVDLTRFAEHLDPDKTLIDLGCGNGTSCPWKVPAACTMPRIGGMPNASGSVRTRAARASVMCKDSALTVTPSRSSSVTTSIALRGE